MIPAFAPIHHRVGLSAGSSGERFHGLVADRINMLKPSIIRKGGGGSSDHAETDGIAANLITNWIASDEREFVFGGSSTPWVTIGSDGIFAPDGSTNARRIVENSTNNVHELHAGFDTSGSQRKIKYRLEVFAKINERSRIRLEIANGGTAVNPTARMTGVRATYDLLNGAIGVPAAIYGSTIVIGETFAFSNPSAEIIRYPDSWFKCILEGFSTDTSLSPIGGSIVCTISMDNGTGAEASSTSYTGDGSSSVYIWSTRLLPSRVYEMNDRVFHDDFDSAATIDTNKTSASGFKWYPSFKWPSYTDQSWFNNINLNSSTFNTHYSVSDSTLNLLEDNSGQNYTIATAAWDGASGYVGKTFRPPAFFETRSRWDPPVEDFPIISVGSGRPAFWTFDTAIVLHPNFWSATSLDGAPHWFNNHSGTIPLSSETLTGNFVLNFTYLPTWVAPGQHLNGTGIAANTRVASCVAGASGTVTLDKAVIAPGTGSPGFIRFERGIENDFYEVANDHTQSGDINTAFASILSIGCSIVNMVTNQGYGVGLSTSHDVYSAFHLWQRLWLPATATEHGMVISFCNGVLADNSLRQYSNTITEIGSPPSFATEGVFVAGDTHDFVLVVGGGNGAGVGGNQTWPVYHDYASVYV